MFKTKALSIILTLTMATVILAGCAKAAPTSTTIPKTTPAVVATPAPATTKAAETTASTTAKLVDGIYKVEYDSFDTRGYKGQLELTISGVKITDVKYDEVMKDGKLKSKDAAYKKSMEAVTKTYPEKAYTELDKQLIDKQSTDIDGVSGATSATNSFKGLAKYALEDMALKGTTAPAKIKAVK